LVPQDGRTQRRAGRGESVSPPRADRRHGRQLGEWETRRRI